MPGGHLLRGPHKTPREPALEVLLHGQDRFGLRPVPLHDDLEGLHARERPLDDRRTHPVRQRLLPKRGQPLSEWRILWQLAARVQTHGSGREQNGEADGRHMHGHDGGSPVIVHANAQTRQPCPDPSGPTGVRAPLPRWLPPSRRRRPEG